MTSGENPVSCTPAELRILLTHDTGGIIVYPTEPYNQVFPGIYLGRKEAAMDKSLLVRMGITHVLNTAQGPERQLNLVDTSDDYYDDVGIKFMGIFALDLSSFNISKYFKQCSDFIEDALANNGKVFVHCMQGISRSATIVLAFLMMKRGMNIRDACREVRKAREIFPNDGFLYQLCLLQDSPELNARPAILGKP